MRKLITIAVLALALSVILPASLTSLANTEANPQTVRSGVQAKPAEQNATATFHPTSTLRPTWTLTPSLTPTTAPLVFATNTPQGGSGQAGITIATQAPIHSPTPGNGLDGSGTPLPSWTPPPADPAAQVPDHYFLFRPIGENGVNYLDRTYPYGGTAGGSLQVHHGADFANGQGTPILAAGNGVVFYAGDDLTTLFGPAADYYGNLVVIQHNFTSPDGQTVYTLYGHMSRVDVETGQSISAGDRIGEVGGTGVAFGAHLHFEVRLGDAHSFDATRNPDLWIYPYRNYGTLAGRVTDSAGTVLYSAPITVRSLASQVQRYTFTYPDNSVNGDSVFQENFALGDLPANYYEVSVNDGQRVRYRQIIYVYPNQTTWVDIVLN